MSCCCKQSAPGVFEPRARFDTEYNYWHAEVWRDGKRVWDDNLGYNLFFKGPQTAHRKARREIRRRLRAIRKGWTT